jgi:hypothetical protein
MLSVLFVVRVVSRVTITPPLPLWERGQG